MKNLKWGFMLNRDKNTESLKPFLISTLARFVFFPDGKSLLEKWETDIKSSLHVVHSNEVTKDDNDSSYAWSCTTFGDDSFMVSGHFRPSVDNTPTIIGTDESGTGGYIIMTRIDSEGNTYEEKVPYGASALIEQYRFAIPIPTKFIGDRTANFSNASFNITEGSESNFLSHNTFHNMYCEFKNGTLFIYVNHFKGLDSIDMSNLHYITGDFNISIDGLFV